MSLSNLKNHILRKWYIYLAWAVAAVAVCLWAFTFVTDVRADKKLAVFIGADPVDIAAVHDIAVSRCGDGIEQVDIYSHNPSAGTFVTAMSAFGLEMADIVILPEDKIPDAAAYFLPLTDGYKLTLRDGTTYYKSHGADFGVKVTSAPDGAVSYEEGVNYYLFFNRKSLHTGILSGSASDAALKVAEVFYEEA